MTPSISETIRQILAEQALMEISDIEPGMSLTDLGLDSLGLVETVFAIEEAFDIQVPFNSGSDDADHDHPFDTSSVAAIIAAVEDMVAQK